MNSRRIALPIAAVVLVAAGGCGGIDTPPAEEVPELRSLLSDVDSALAEGEYGDAREALDGLIRETIARLGTGDLDPEQADDILAAATRLAADLPDQRPTPEPTETVEEQRDDDGGDGEDGEDGENDDHGKKGKKDKDKDKGRNGNGRDNGNGRKKGHGSS